MLLPRSFVIAFGSTKGPTGMIYLLLVLLSMVIAPFVYTLVAKLEKSFVLVEAVLFFCIAGLVVLHILPDAFLHAGWGALAVFFVAWILPTAVERMMHRHEHAVHVVPVVLSTLGLLIHSLTDGVALSYANEGGYSHFEGLSLHYHPLPIAVVLHSFPASVFLYWVLKPKYGSPFAVGMLFVLGLTTVIGYISGSEYLQNIHNSYQMGLFEGLAAGSLMHLASHRIKHDH